MCVISIIMDHKSDEWRRRLDKLTDHRFVYPPAPPAPPLITPGEIAEFRRLLDRARQYDRDHNEPDCELEEKRQLLRELAEKLGVNIDFIDEARAGKG